MLRHARKLYEQQALYSRCCTITLPNIPPLLLERKPTHSWPRTCEPRSIHVSSSSLSYRTIAEARRVYRQCRYLDAWSSLLDTVRRGDPSWEKLVTLLRYFSLILHYVTDQMVFLHAHGMLQQKLPHIDKWKKQSSGWWGLR